MCGRYYVDEEMLHEIKKITRKIDEKFGNVRTGEILPSQNAMVLTGKTPELSAEIMQWGFPRYDKKGLIINARAESVKEKKTFRDSAIHRRCIVPAAHYFEWDKEKSKTTLSRTDEGIVYMAGIYQYRRQPVAQTGYGYRPVSRTLLPRVLGLYQVADELRAERGHGLFPDICAASYRCVA